jgi:hypothetical protein
MKNWNALWTPSELEIFAGLRSPQSFKSIWTAWLQHGFLLTAVRAACWRIAKPTVSTAHCSPPRRCGVSGFHADHRSVAHRDDDHLLALYRVNGCWGAVAKSNFVVCAFVSRSTVLCASWC